MPDIRCDDCSFNKMLARYEGDFIIFKCDNRHNGSNPKCKMCNRLRRIKLTDLLSSSSDILI